jgi:multiple sugar transport system substrate-binding protein
MFVKAHPGVTTQTASPVWNDYFTKINVEAASKTLPCVIQLQNRQVADYVKSGSIIPLDNMVASGVIDVSGIPKGVVNAGRGTDGKLYFLPYGLAYDAMVVNTTLAAKSGINPPASNYNWNDFFALVSAAQPKLPKGDYAVDSVGDLANLFVDWVYANGGEAFTKDGKIGFSKNTLTTYWNIWERLRKEGASLPPAKRAEEPSAPEGSFFAKGSVLASSFGGNRVAAVQTSLTGTDPGATATGMLLPTGSGAKGNPLYASGFAISSNCTNVPTAAAFVNFFANDLKAGEFFAADNGDPSNTKVMNALLATPNLSAATKADLALYQVIEKNNPTSIVFPAGYQAQFDASFTRDYDAVTFGKMSVSQAVDTFFSEVNPSLG